jgi:hypothetical protein
MASAEGAAVTALLIPTQIGQPRAQALHLQPDCQRRRAATTCINGAISGAQSGTQWLERCASCLVVRDKNPVADKADWGSMVIT